MLLTRHSDIPEFKRLNISHATDSGSLPEELTEVISKTYKEVLINKKRWKPLLKKTPRVSTSYVIGPINMPIDSFVSCRWNELRTKVPLAMDESSWRWAWRFWRGANSYKKIKSNIEKHGMRQAILAEVYLNHEPGFIWHKCIAFRGENPEWPILITISGNERIMMAWFEWNWKTIPTMIVIRDCGFSDIFSEVLKWYYRKKLRKLKKTKCIYRSIYEKY